MFLSMKKKSRIRGIARVLSPTCVFVLVTLDPAPGTENFDISEGEKKKVGHR